MICFNCLIITIYKLVMLLFFTILVFLSCEVVAFNVDVIVISALGGIVSLVLNCDFSSECVTKPCV